MIPQYVQDHVKEINVDDLNKWKNETYSYNALTSGVNVLTSIGVTGDGTWAVRNNKHQMFYFDTPEAALDAYKKLLTEKK